MKHLKTMSGKISVFADSCNTCTWRYFEYIPSKCECVCVCVTGKFMKNDIYWNKNEYRSLVDLLTYSEPKKLFK